jgi:hypothetical protein
VRIVAVLALVSILGACATPEQRAAMEAQQRAHMAEMQRLVRALTPADAAACRYEAHAGGMNARGGALYQIAEENNLMDMCLGAHALANIARQESALAR